VKKGLQIVLGVTGSIAAYKTCDIIRKLSEKGFSVTAVMTKSAERFITPLTLSRLSGNKVYTELFSNGTEDVDYAHVSLGKLADVLLIAPATANFIGKIAHGIADDLLTCTCLSTRAKMIIAPAMNPAMFRNKIVQENCAKLKKNGVDFVGPITGKVACGDQGIGHIADVEDIVKAVLRSVKK